MKSSGRTKPGQEYETCSGKVAQEPGQDYGLIVAET